MSDLVVARCLINVNAIKYCILEIACSNSLLSDIIIEIRVSLRMRTVKHIEYDIIGVSIQCPHMYMYCT